jgi:hypothetical protein
LSLPGFFPPAKVFGSEYFDGSAVYDLDIFTAVKKCFEKGYKESDIVVDTILTSTVTLSNVDPDSLYSTGMLMRFLEVHSFYNSMDAVLRAKFAFPKMHFRYAFSPTATMPSSYFPLVSIKVVLIIGIELK